MNYKDACTIYDRRSERNHQPQNQRFMTAVKVEIEAQFDQGITDTTTVYTRAVAAAHTEHTERLDA